VSVLLAGCSVQPATEVDPAQIEAAVREYYEAFNCYDLDRIEAVFTKQTWREERWDFVALIRWAKENNFKSEFVSIISMEIEGDSVWAMVEVESGVGSGKDYHRLVREHGSWKIAKLFTKKVSSSQPGEMPSSSCCP